jgi:predicted dehydrogenase
MNVIIIGSGRMGIRHAQGIANIGEIETIKMVDITQSALDNAKTIFQQNHVYSKFQFSKLEDINTEGGEVFEIAILASTANNRLELFNTLVKLGCKYFLVEKPIGQSYEEVIEFSEIVSKSGLNCFVNLNMRLYESFIRLKNDLKKIPQLKGSKTITLNTGSLGIGANGIHYLDLLYFLLDADSAEIKAADIDETIIPSGRGSNFCDFGGWSVINFYQNNELVGRAMLSMSSKSTVFGSWDIVAPHGRIYLNEVEQKRVDTLRKEDSTMPVNRYFSDYLPPIESEVNSPFLGELTAKWISALLEGENLLPTVEESIRVHALMFDWLNYSKTHKKHFPIT